MRNRENVARLKTFPRRKKTWSKPKQLCITLKLLMKRKDGWRILLRDTQHFWKRWKNFFLIFFWNFSGKIQSFFSYLVKLTHQKCFRNIVFLKFPRHHFVLQLIYILPYFIFFLFSHLPHRTYYFTLTMKKVHTFFNK